MAPTKNFLAAVALLLAALAAAVPADLTVHWFYPGSTTCTGAAAYGAYDAEEQPCSPQACIAAAGLGFKSTCTNAISDLFPGDSSLDGYVLLESYGNSATCGGNSTSGYFYKTRTCVAYDGSYATFRCRTDGTYVQRICSDSQCSQNCNEKAFDVNECFAMSDDEDEYYIAACFDTNQDASNPAAPRAAGAAWAVAAAALAAVAAVAL